MPTREELEEVLALTALGVGATPRAKYLLLLGLERERQEKKEKERVDAD